MYQCTVCSRSFKRNEHLTRHKRSHVADRPFTCPICVRSFTRQDSLLRHLSSHAKSPTRSSQLRQGSKADESDQVYASVEEDSQVLPDTTPLPEPRRSNPDPTGAASVLTKIDSISSANIEDETDIDVPPELIGNHENLAVVQPNNNEHCINTSIELHSPLGGASDHAHAMGSAQTYDSPGPNYDADIVYRRHSARSPSRPDLLDCPEALYSDRVDVHARKWLKDFCS
ncbi:hypothetical protein PV04_01990 [Phialophora macrospora]|uniref:C2H2-type domain-containing protein n=1 Tax=Phialophora macrospora TaxID=1851006 RepID=A0A0D2D8L3_9EURO|nr:hypothetical protein PV04_01990 [Phialophora macrospora]